MNISKPKYDPISEGSGVPINKALSTLDEEFNKLKYTYEAHPLFKVENSLFPLISIDTNNVFLNTNFDIAPVYYSGFYSKFDRELSQTPMEFATQSVSDLIAKHIVQLCNATDYKFSSSGREDLDVRLLSENESGRQFCVELINSKRPISSSEDCAKLQIMVNEDEEAKDRIKIFFLKRDTSSIFLQLKVGEEKKRKEYRCVVWSSKLLSQSDLIFPTDLEISQKTPLRVLHRRSALARLRKIFEMKAEILGGINGKSHFFTFDLVTQAGTYIKEFVHGDLGRTYPNLGSILNCNTDILQLDVKGLINIIDECENDDGGD